MDGALKWIDVMFAGRSCSIKTSSYYYWFDQKFVLHWAVICIQWSSTFKVSFKLNLPTTLGIYRDIGHFSSCAKTAVCILVLSKFYLLNTGTVALFEDNVLFFTLIFELLLSIRLLILKYYNSFTITYAFIA